MLFLGEGLKVRRASELPSVTPQGAYNSEPDNVFGLATLGVGRNSEEEEVVGPLEVRLASCAPAAGLPLFVFWGGLGRVDRASRDSRGLSAWPDGETSIGSQRLSPAPGGNGARFPQPPRAAYWGRHRSPGEVLGRKFWRQQTPWDGCTLKSRSAINLIS